VSFNFVFVGCAATLVLGTITLVAFVGKVVDLAGVCIVDITTMSPAIIGVVVRTLDAVTVTGTWVGPISLDLEFSEFSF
jgi:hypothetical protein